MDILSIHGKHCILRTPFNLEPLRCELTALHGIYESVGVLSVTIWIVPGSQHTVHHRPGLSAAHLFATISPPLLALLMPLLFLCPVLPGRTATSTCSISSRTFLRFIIIPITTITVIPQRDARHLNMKRMSGHDNNQGIFQT